MPEVDVMAGNKAIAYGVKLSRVKVIPVYPITPQTTMCEYIAQFIADGELDAEYVTMEGEHSVMAAAIGAELSGARTFTSTCSEGLAYMHECVAQAPAWRLPIVMAIANRTLAGLWNLGPDYSDVMPEKDLCWTIYFAESNQECLDTVIQSYRVAEDSRVLLPAMICLDGFYLSYSYEPVEIPDQGDVDVFLPPYKAEHVIMDPTTRFERPMNNATSALHTTFVRFQEEAMERAGDVILEVNEEFGKRFGRRYGNGLIEKYKCEGADVVLVTMGAMTTAARRAVDRLREKGDRIGLVRLKTFRPFPAGEFAEIAEEVEAMGVVDRVNLYGVGGRGGAAFVDIRSSLYDIEEKPLLMNFIAGLAGKDVKVEDFEFMARKTLEAAERGRVERAVTYMEDPEAVKRFSPPPEPSVYVEGELIQPGTAACWGCGIPLVLRHMLDILGPNTVMARAPGCAGVNLGITPFQTMLGIPYTLSNFASTAAMATGLKRGLRSRGKADVNVVALCGDGGTVDIGLQSLSGAAERGESLIFICYDNEAYMNTGIQRSGSTPLGAWTTTTPVGKVWRGKKRTRKNIDLIMAAHKIPYVATASVAYIRDYKRKIKKAFEVTRAGKGLAFIHVHQPCPTGWRFPGEKAIEVARTAVQTGAWSLFEAEEGKLRVNVKPRELVPVSEYLKSQGRFRHLSEEQIANIQEVVTGNYEKLLELEKTGIY